MADTDGADIEGRILTVGVHDVLDILKSVSDCALAFGTSSAQAKQVTSSTADRSFGLRIRGSSIKW